MFLGCGNYPKCKNIRRIENKIGVKCPKCGGDIIQRRSKKGRVFYGCNNYPKCDFVLWAKPTGEKCPKCQSLLVYGPKETIRCSNKECSYTQDRPLKNSKDKL
jgi:DNA topoisomerase-1